MFATSRSCPKAVLLSGGLRLADRKVFRNDHRRGQCRAMLAVTAYYGPLSYAVHFVQKSKVTIVAFFLQVFPNSGLGI